MKYEISGKLLLSNHDITINGQVQTVFEIHDLTKVESLYYRDGKLKLFANGELFFSVDGDKYLAARLFKDVQSFMLNN